MAKALSEAEGFLEFSEEIDKKDSNKEKPKKKRIGKLTKPSETNPSINTFKDDRFDIDESMTSCNQRVPLIVDTIDDVRTDEKMKTTFEHDETLLEKIKSKNVLNAEDGILDFTKLVKSSAELISSDEPKVVKNVDHDDDDDSSPKEVIVKKIIKVKKKKLKPKIEAIETPQPMTSLTDHATFINDQDRTSLVATKGFENTKSKSSEILDSLIRDGCLSANQETIRHAETFPPLNLDVENDYQDDEEKFQLDGKYNLRFNGFNPKSVVDKLSHLDQDYENQLFEKYLNFSEGKYDDAKLDQLETKHTKKMHDCNGYDDDDDDIIGNIDYYLREKLSKDVNPTKSQRSKIDLDEEEWEDSDQELYLPRNSRPTNHRADKDGGEALMDQVRREKNLKATTQRRNSMFQPKRRGDTDEKVAEKTKHVKALIDRQMAVVDNIRSSIQKFAELETLIKDLKAESLEQKAELENLEDLFDIVYNKYKNETTSADNAIKMQKRESKTNLNKHEFMLKELFAPQKQNFKNQFVPKNERINKLDFQLLDTCSDFSKNKLSSEESHTSENLSLPNYEDFGIKFSAVKDFNDKFPKKSKKNDLHREADDNQTDATDMTSLTAEEFINRIKNKYVIEPPNINKQINNLKTQPRIFNSRQIRDDTLKILPELQNNLSNFNRDQVIQSAMERKIVGQNRFK